MPENRVTFALASHAEHVRTRRLTASEIRLAKVAIVDSIACSVGALQLDAAGHYLQAILSEGGTPQSLVYGTTIRLPATRAVLANGFLANLLDFDDTYESFGHFGAVIVPPTLAIAELLGAKPDLLIRSIIAGYEIAARLGTSLKPSPERAREVRGFVTWQLFGAVAAVGTLMNFDREEFAEAFGAAAVHAPVPFQNKWGYEDARVSWFKNNSGWAAMAALMACMWVKSGVQASKSIFDGNNGFWRMCGTDRFDEDALFDEVGPTIDALSIKPYPCCRFLNTTVEAASLLGQKPDLSASTIEEIQVDHAMAFVRRNFMISDPQTQLDAQFSLPYVTALGLIANPMDPDNYDPRSWVGREALELSRRVTRIGDQVKGDQSAESAGMASRVTVFLEGGRSLTKLVREPLGSPKRPLSDSDLQSKWIDLLTPAFSESAALSLVDTILGVDKDGDLEAVWRSMTRTRATLEGGWTTKESRPHRTRAAPVQNRKS